MNKDTPTGATSSFKDSPLNYDTSQYSKKTAPPPPPTNINNGTTGAGGDYGDQNWNFLSPLFDGPRLSITSRHYGESPQLALRRQNSSGGANNGDILPNISDYLRFGRNESVYSEFGNEGDKNLPNLPLPLALEPNKMSEVPPLPPHRRDDSFKIPPNFGIPPTQQQPENAIPPDPIRPEIPMQTKPSQTPMEEDIFFRGEYPNNGNHHERETQVKFEPQAKEPAKVAWEEPTATGLKCKCSKSHCLKLYCVCLAKGAMCAPDCSCKSCMNNEKYKDKREAALQIIKERNVMAIEAEAEGKPIPAEDTFKHDVLEGNILKINKGCSCKRSGCKKRYCECFSDGKQCTIDCLCANCKNAEAGIPKRKGKVIKKTNRSVLYRKKPSIKVD